MRNQLAGKSTAWESTPQNHSSTPAVTNPSVLPHDALPLSIMKFFIYRYECKLSTTPERDQTFRYQGCRTRPPAPAEAGPRLRQLRLSRKLTLLDVAERSGVTKGFLSLLERGRLRVSVPTLLRICEAIGINIGSLFDYPAETFEREGSPVQMGGADIDECFLTPRDEELIQVMCTLLRPGGGSAGAHTLDAVTIFAIALRGQLDLIVDSVPLPLAVGESTTFSARLLHEWSNPADSETEVLWVIAPPLPRDLLPQTLRA